MQETLQQVMDELEEQKEVIKDLMDQLGKKSLEVYDIKKGHLAEIATLQKQIDEAY